MAALIVWRRFSAWSKTIEAGDSNTSSVTSRAVEPVLFEDLLPDLGLSVVQGGQAVHELDLRVARCRHDIGVHLVGKELVDALAPFLGRLAHRQPDVGVEEVGVRPRASCTSSVTVTRAPEPTASRSAHAVHLGRGPERLRGGEADVDAEQGAGDEQRVGGVVAGIAEVAVGDLVERAGRVVAHGQHVGQHLGRMPLVGEPVPDRHARRSGPGSRRCPGQKPRYSMPSNIRPSTRAVSFIDSLWPSWDSSGPR